LQGAHAALFMPDGAAVPSRGIVEGIAGAGAPDGLLKERAFLLGRTCDRLDDADAAFAAFSEGNRIQRNMPDGQACDGARVRNKIAALSKRFSAEWVAEWKPLEPVADRPSPVFLVGFPRSGTTSLDTILPSHPDVTVVEEMPVLARGGGDPERLAGCPGHA